MVELISNCIKHIYGIRWNKRAVVAITKQMTKPKAVGSKKEQIVHFKLRVSFLMVKHVVEHGQCSRQKTMVHKAVTHVQPLFKRSVYNCGLLSSIRLLVDIQVMIIIGTTISLAGNPRIKANKITPSSPIKCPKGSRK